MANKQENCPNHQENSDLQEIIDNKIFKRRDYHMAYFTRALLEELFNAP